MEAKFIMPVIQFGGYVAVFTSSKRQVEFNFNF